MKKLNYGNERSFSVIKDGKVYKGEYLIDHEMIIVSCGFEKKTAALGGHAIEPEILARVLLLEIIKEKDK